MYSLSHSPVVPSGLSACKCGITLSTSHCLALPVLQPPPCYTFSLPTCPSRFNCMRMWDCPVCQPSPRPLCQPLPISAPPTGLDECFFFNSLVVRLPYSLIFCQFWLYFVFKFVVVLLLVVRGSTVCLPMPPPCLEVPGSI